MIYTAPKIESIRRKHSTDMMQTKEDVAPMAILEDETVEIECLSSGIPKPEVTWVSRRGRRTETSTPGAILTIESAKLVSDDGTYACIAANEYGSDSAQLNITVYHRMKVKGERKLRKEFS